MKKELLIIFIAFFLLGFVFSVQADELTISDNNDLSDSSEKVCCKVYGLGNRMKQVNIRYGWIEENECVTPTEFVGGGREIVDNQYCEIKTPYQAKILTQEQIQNTIQEKNRLRVQAQEGGCTEGCTCTGSTTKCEIEGGREMTVMAGKSGNMIVQVKRVNMSTNVTLYKSGDKVYGVFRNNETREINIFPDEVEEKIKNKTKARLENRSIELDEEGIYRVQGKKRARLFFLFPVREKVRAQIDSETGEVIRIRNPWWGFLARDSEEETPEANETNETD